MRMKTGKKLTQHEPSGGCPAGIEAEPSASTRPFDLESLLVRCLDDRQFCGALVAKFSQRAAELAAGLDAAAAAGSAAEVARQAHAIAGLAANVSAERLRFWAAALERASRGGAANHARTLVAKVRAEIDRCSRAVPRLLDQLAER
jgi:HPt (histidine-containing phosphotransfer) domain-containing protein